VEPIKKRGGKEARMEMMGTSWKKGRGAARTALVFWLGVWAAIALPMMAAEKAATKNGAKNGEYVRWHQFFFFNANLGIFIFQQSTAATEKTFVAYGEDGAVKQSIHVTSPLGLEVNAGRYFPLGKWQLKAGLGLNAFPLKASGNFTLSMPHPYLYNSPRNYYFSEEWKNSSLHFYAFAYLVPIETWRLQISLGPIVGYSTGKYPGLEDLEIEDKSPFSWSDLEIKNKTFKTDSFSTLSVGGGLNLAFFLAENMALVMSYKWQHLKPHIDVLKDKVNLSFSRLIFCVEFSL